MVVIVFALVLYYLVFSNSDKIEKTKVSNQLPTEDRVFDYDTKYNDAVKDINDAVELNLEKHNSIGEVIESTQPISELEEAVMPE